MSDRELLEAAAKAAGNPIGTSRAGNGLLMANDLYWNPLNNSGDALRLMVKLRLLRVGLGECIGRGAYSHIAILESGPDPYAATRRAIVRAAAEIGRSMV